MPSIKAFLTFLATLGLVACQPSALRTLSAPALFQNSLRRDAEANEDNRAALVDFFNCAGYFVGNSTGKVLVMSARHCFDDHPEAWCADRSHSTVDEVGGTARHCQNVALAPAGSDLVILQFDGPAPTHTLALSDDTVPLNQRLVMYGYPADDQASGNLMVTENCWVTSPLAGSFWPENPDDIHFRHNCSTWGGNSGGPMVAEGSRVVMAQPGCYFDGDYHEHAADGAEEELPWAADMGVFTLRNRARLRQLGVELRTPETALLDTHSHVTVRSGTYRDDDCLTSRFKITVRAEYMTSNRIQQIAVRFTRGDVFTRILYKCDADGVCTTHDDGGRTSLETVEAPDELALVFHERDGDSSCLLTLVKADFY